MFQQVLNFGRFEDPACQFDLNATPSAAEHYYGVGMSKWFAFEARLRSLDSILVEVAFQRLGASNLRGIY